MTSQAEQTQERLAEELAKIFRTDKELELDYAREWVFCGVSTPRELREWLSEGYVEPYKVYQIKEKQLNEGIVSVKEIEKRYQEDISVQTIETSEQIYVTDVSIERGSKAEELLKDICKVADKVGKDIIIEPNRCKAVGSEEDERVYRQLDFKWVDNRVLKRKRRQKESLETAFKGL